MPTVSTARFASPRAICRAALLCLGVGTLGTAIAEPNPYYLGAGVTLGHDSNIARTSGNELSDNYTEAFLLAGLDQPIGRQRLYADARVARTKFNDESQFDFTGYNVRLGVDWEALDRMKGDLRYTNSRNRTTDAGSADGEKNLETAQEFFFRAQYGLVSTYSLEGELVHRQLDDSNEKFETNEVKQDSVKLGVLYRPSGLTTLGVGLRHTWGEYTNRPEGGFDRNDLEFTAKWVATGQSTLDALIAIGRENQDNPEASDVSGVTGLVRWTYKPTGKLQFITEASRERGSDSAFSNVNTNTNNGTGNPNNQITDLNQSRVSNALAIGAFWEATAKIGVTADGRYVRRDVSSLAGGVETDGKDRTTILALGVRYAITRNIEALCKVGREKRSVSEGNTITNPYSANFYSCSAQIVLR